MATVSLNIQEQAILIATLRINDPDEFADARPSEIVAAAERWLASKIEKTDWANLNYFDTRELVWHLRADRILNRFLGVRE